MKESYWIFKNSIAFCTNCNQSIKPHILPTPYCIYCGCYMKNWRHILYNFWSELGEEKI